MKTRIAFWIVVAAVALFGMGNAMLGGVPMLEVRRAFTP